MMQLAVAVIVALSTGSAAAIPGLDDPDVKQALALLQRDPPIAALQQAAVQHFAVSKVDMTDYRAAARLRALLPALSGSFAQDASRASRSSTDQAQFPLDPLNPQIVDDSSDIGRTYVASATWNLGDLVFSPSQLETYALVGIHEDVVKEVTRLYYTRQHNILALALEPPKDLRARAALILRTREIEAMLDVLTGGAWTRLSGNA